MAIWDHIVEERIREWLARPAAERDRPSLQQDAAAPLEVQLMREIELLDRLAAETPELDFAKDLRARGSALMLRLMVLLENDGRPLAARHFAEQRQERQRALAAAARGAGSPGQSADSSHAGRNDESRPPVSEIGPGRDEKGE